MKLGNGKKLDVQYPISLKDSNGNETYHEDSNGIWYKKEFDPNGNETYYKDSDGYWFKKEYDLKGNRTYYENSNGFWSKREYDSNANKTYFEDSDGYVSGKKRLETQKLTMEEVCKLLNMNVEIVEG